VAGVTGVAPGHKRGHFKRRLAVQARVDEQYAGSAHQVQYMFDLQLVIFKKLNLIAQPLRKSVL